FRPGGRGRRPLSRWRGSHPGGAPGPHGRGRGAGAGPRRRGGSDRPASGRRGVVRGGGPGSGEHLAGGGPPRLRRVSDASRPRDEAWSEAAALVRESIEPESDLHASAEYRKHVAGVLTRRALSEAAARAGGETE